MIGELIKNLHTSIWDKFHEIESLLSLQERQICVQKFLDIDFEAKRKSIEHNS